MKKYNIIIIRIGGKSNMLMGFKFKNFKSFEDLQYFSMIAGKVRNNENHITEINGKKILKFSGMYGANGSGKSNFILALSLFQDIASKGVSTLINNLYYRGANSNKDDNSYFEYELCLNEKYYSYGFEINIPKRQIVSEWLIDMTKKNPKVIFERDINKEYYYPDNLNKKYSNFENCLSEMRANTNDLFLKEMNRRLMMSKNNDEYYLDIKSVYKFLMYDTTIIRPSTHKLFGMDYIKNKDKIIDILNKLDINIVDIIEEKSSLDMIYAKMSNLDFSNFMDELNNLLSKFNNLKCTLRIENDLYTIKREKDEYKVSSLKFKHANSNDSFGAYEESDGTIRILELIDILLTNHKLFLIDELDSSLHPVLVDGLLKIFLSSKKTNQLIITTHESKTLDFDLVRRDEIWFSEKNKKGASRIYSLEEYKDVARFDKKIDKAYLEGRFGAVAQIDTNYED